MATEALCIFDPRRNIQLQGFTGRVPRRPRSTMRPRRVCPSPAIFQAAEDFAVLGLYNAYNYFDHLRAEAPAANGPFRPHSGVRHRVRPRRSMVLCGWTPPSIPSVSWDAMTFVCAAGTRQDTYDVRLLDYALPPISGGETPASVLDARSPCSENARMGESDCAPPPLPRHALYRLPSTDCRVGTQAKGDFGPEYLDTGSGLPCSGYTVDDLQTGNICSSSAGHRHHRARLVRTKRMAPVLSVDTHSRRTALHPSMALSPIRSTTRPAPT